MSVDAVGPARQGRSARRNLWQTHDIKMLPALKRDLLLTEPIDEEQIHRIDKTSMNILKISAYTFAIRLPSLVGKMPVRRLWTKLFILIAI